MNQLPSVMTLVEILRREQLDTDMVLSDYPAPWT